MWKLPTNDESGRAAVNHGGDTSVRGKAKSIEFISAQYDEIHAFKKYSLE